jgi:hypothetical protein
MHHLRSAIALISTDATPPTISDGSDCSRARMVLIVVVLIAPGGAGSNSTVMTVLPGRTPAT